MQKVQIKNWGNSKAIRIPINILESLDLKENSVLDIRADIENNTITLTVDDGLTPYQKLMAKGKGSSNRKPFIWNSPKEEEGSKSDFYSSKTIQSDK